MFVASALVIQLNLMSFPYSSIGVSPKTIEVVSVIIGSLADPDCRRLQGLRRCCRDSRGVVAKVKGTTPHN
jgi:hypothetical protein